MKLLIKYGRLIDPASNTDEEFDIFIADGKIVKIDKNIKKDDAQFINAKDCIVVPGLVDMHVHFREPGREDVETIIGGSRVAAKSGYTSVCTMPNTNPVIDNQALVRYIKKQAESGPINVFPVAAITKGSMGEELTEMGELVEGGAIAFSDDGKPVMNSTTMRRALEYSRMFNVPIITHAEDITLSSGGIMNEGNNSIFLGLKGIPREAEEIMIARDVLLTRLTKGRLHVAHVSSKGSLDIITMAKRNNIQVTCETAPHYFSLTDDAIAEHLSMAKMNPPLRTEEDRKAIIEALRNGLIEVIATDHAPHLPNEKMQEIAFAPFGIIGLETAVPLIITVLIKGNGFNFIQAFEKVTVNPCKILGIDRGYIKEGGVADITIINPDKKINVNDDFIISRCKNTPFMGRELFGQVEYTICNGIIVYPFS
ncbi:MAG TPA: dihydroorotase [Spirochaetota bacterium]|nr:dihydroorotase [Spirochaetota bacterium]HOM10858.1 dihydroorotase [Spirochaetota bacterium]HPP50729.1 dihydroorotase [Spirochaetota bacterium]